MKEAEKNFIFYKLNKFIKDFIKIYGEENLFGVFTLDKGETVTGIVIPPFEDVCLNTPRIEETPFEGATVLDIRFLYTATKEGYPHVVNALYTDFYIINPRYEHLYEKLIHPYADCVKDGIISGQPAEQLKLFIVKIMRTAFNENSKVVRFIKQLTDAEKLGLQGIVSAIGDEGIITQYKIAAAVGVSKNTISTLVLKMKESEVAEVKLLGNQGTYIKIIDDTLLNPNGINLK